MQSDRKDLIPNHTENANYKRMESEHRLKATRSMLKPSIPCVQRLVVRAKSTPSPIFKAETYEAITPQKSKHRFPPLDHHEPLSEQHLGMLTTQPETDSNKQDPQR